MTFAITGARPSMSDCSADGRSGGTSKRQTNYGLQDGALCHVSELRGHLQTELLVLPSVCASSATNATYCSHVLQAWQTVQLCTV